VTVLPLGGKAPALEDLEHRRDAAWPVVGHGRTVRYTPSFLLDPDPHSTRGFDAVRK
jgi:hypothetical protein